MEIRKRKSNNVEAVTIDKKKKSNIMVGEILNEYEETNKSSKRQTSKKNLTEKKEEISLDKIEGNANKDIDGNNRFENWSKIKSVLVKNYGSNPSSKILGFDLDDTLIVPKSGAKFAKNRNDWKFLNEIEAMKKILSKYLNEGYRIVIFTNQNGIPTGRTDETEWKGKVDDIVKQLSLPIIVLAALEKDFYRKPSIGMWRLLENEIDNNIMKLDPLSFIYVGDAAGRDKNFIGKKDHSDSDYKFALNVVGTFQTPEEFFQGHKTILPNTFSFNPADYKKPEVQDKKLEINEKQQEMVIFVGSPASGKSSYYTTYFAKHNYIHINNDTLKTAVKCLKATEDALSSGNSVVVDNTNPTKDSRINYISLAEKFKVPVRCFYFKYTKGLVFHLNNLRDINLGRKHHTKSVPNVVIHTWFKNLEEPSMAEGFKEIKTIPFVAGPFENPLDEEIFYMHSSA